MLLSDIKKQIHKKFGKESLIDHTHKVDVEVIPTGSIGLDAALGVGGLPRGRIIEIFGEESCGKTTLALHAMSNAHRCVFVDTEQTFDWDYAKTLGVNIKDVLISQPDCGEDALNIITDLATCDDVDLIILDSVAALLPKAEIDGDIGDSHVGLVARLMSQTMRKLVAVTRNSKVCVVFINQLRANIGAFGYGPKKTPTGGNSLKFYCSVRLEVKRIGKIKVKDEIVGSRTRVKVVKNKLAPPFRQVDFDLIHGKGIQNEIFEKLLSDGVISQGGAWFTIGDEKFQGKPAAQDYVNLNGKKLLSKYYKQEVGNSSS